MKFVFSFVLLAFLSACGVFHTNASRQSEYILTDTDKTRVFKTSDLTVLMSHFEKVLKEEAFEIENIDLKAGLLKARAKDTNKFLKSYSNFNSGFVGVNNYKVSDDLEVLLRLVPEKEGIHSYLNIRKVERFSMGQEEFHDINDSNLYKTIFSKVEADSKSEDKKI